MSFFSIGYLYQRVIFFPMVLPFHITIGRPGQPVISAAPAAYVGISVPRKWNRGWSRTASHRRHHAVRRKWSDVRDTVSIYAFT
jgi:hypothetical protein